MKARQIALVGLAVALCLTAVFAFKKKPTNVDAKVQQIPVNIQQLPLEGGKIPVEIQRPKIQLSAPDEIDSYSCAVKNNSTKAITALAVEWTFTANIKGKESSISSFTEMDALVHPDVRDYRKLGSLTPGNETIMESSSTTTAPSSAQIIKADVSLKYVEFDDNSIIDLDPEHNSSKRINGEREGARQYKQWLVRAYKQRGSVLTSIVPFLESESLPAELNLTTHHLHHGAKMYRKFLLSLYTNKQQESLEKYLNE